MNNQDYHVHHGQTFLTLQESLLTNFQLIRKDIADHPCIQMKKLVFPPLTIGRSSEHYIFDNLHIHNFDILKKCCTFWRFMRFLIMPM